MRIASSDKTVPKPQRQFSEDNGPKVANDQGHAEETLMNSGAKHVDANRSVCLDCQNTMKKKLGDHRHTIFWKKSRNRL